MSSEPRIIETLEDGLLIRLSDGSRWAINPGDLSKTALWYETQRVVVKEIDGPVYRYVLVNLDTSAPDEAKAAPA